MPMHALSKTLFFTTGTVGLLVLVFLWSALKYGLFRLNYLIEGILNYKFAGFSLTDFLLLAPGLDPGQRIYYLKIVFTSCIGIGSFFLILLSYFPRISWQLRSLSTVASATLFALLSLFWICLINGTEVIKTSEKSAIFGFTAITYLSGIFLLWYAMRPKPRKRTLNAKGKAKTTGASSPKPTDSSRSEEGSTDDVNQTTDSEDDLPESSEAEPNKDAENDDEQPAEEDNDPTGEEGAEPAEEQSVPEPVEADEEEEEDTDSVQENDANADDVSTIDNTSSESSVDPEDGEIEPMGETETEKQAESDDVPGPEENPEKKPDQEAEETESSENLKTA